MLGNRKHASINTGSDCTQMPINDLGPLIFFNSSLLFFIVIKFRCTNMPLLSLTLLFTDYVIHNALCSEE